MIKIGYNDVISVSVKVQNMSNKLTEGQGVPEESY